MTNFYLPAEWHKQQYIQLTWPHTKTDWHNNNILAQITDYFINLATQILNYQDLIISAYDNELKTLITNKLNQKKHKYNFHIYICESNDTWARDHGPITLINEDNEKKILDFTFNAWGGKYSYDKDNKITHSLYEQKAYSNTEYQKIDYILEGGSIDTDGNGTLLTTSSCLFNKNRNSSLTKEKNIEYIKKFLNVDNLVVINNSFLYGDDTDGHIDMIARFINNNTIVYTACDNPENPNYNSLKKLEDELNNIELFKQKNIKLVPLYIPDAIYNEDNEVLPASYVNFLILNNSVLVPIYDNSKYDDMALTIFKKHLPDRDIIGIDSKIAIRQGGSLHCLTMQIPK